jgi:diguanylate cyclase (GGDEF)-like protein
MKNVIILFFVCFLVSFGYAQKIYEREAEKVQLNPLSETVICNECYGGSRVRSIGWERWLEFSQIKVDKTGFYSAFLWVQNNNKTRWATSLRVNGYLQSIFWLEPTDTSLGNIDKVHVRVWLKAGINTISVGRDDGWAVDLDKLSVYQVQNSPEVEYILPPATPMLGLIGWQDLRAILVLSSGFIFGLLCLFLTFRQRKNLALHAPMMFITILMCTLALLFQILDLLDNSLIGSIWWVELRTISIVFFVNGTYLFALRYTGNQALLHSKFTKIWVGLMFLIPIYFIVNYANGTGFARSWWISTDKDFFDIRNDNLGFRLSLINGYQLITAVLTFTVLSLFYSRVSSIYRSQILLVLIANSAGTILGGMVYTAFAFLGLNKGPFYMYMLPITLLMLLVAIWRYQLGTLSPEIWGEGNQVQTNAFVAVNNKGLVVESNPVAQSLFQPKIGQPLAPELNNSLGILEYNGKYYQNKVFPLRGQLGQLHVLYDITELEKTKQLSEQRNQNLLLTNLELEQAKIALEQSNIDFRAANQQLESLQNQLRQQAIRDGLTGVYNRHHLKQQLECWIEQKTVFGLMLFDVDRFREFNSRFGYVGGDAVLRAIGDFLLQQSNQKCVPFRYGGEEFCILLQHSYDEALSQAQMIQEALGNLRVPFGDKELVFTVSSSFACVESHGSNLLFVADEALRSAKQRGRNQLIEANLQPPVRVRGWI